MDGTNNIPFSIKLTEYFNNVDENQKSLYLFLFMVIIIGVHYISYYTYTNYLLTIIIGVFS